MTWSFDKVYQSDGTELNHGSHSTALSAPFAQEFDGKYVWVTCGTAGVAIYEYWGSYCDDEPSFDSIDELDYADYDSGVKKKLRPVTMLTISANTIKRTTRYSSLAESGSSSPTLGDGQTGYYKSTSTTVSALDAKFIARSGDFMYITNGATFQQIYEFNINTQTYVRTIDVKETFNGVDYGMNSNLVAAGGKLWFVGSYFDPGTSNYYTDSRGQTLYVYNLATSTKTGNAIGYRPQSARRWLAPGYNGAVYMTDYNNVSITKYSVDDASYITQVRMNAFPDHIFVNPDRRLFVTSYAGMLTLVDWDDDQMHNDYGTEDGALSLAVDPLDGSMVWFVRPNGRVVRYDLNNIEQLETAATGTDDWLIIDSSDGSYQGLMVTPQFNYTNGSGTNVTVKPYLFLLRSSSISALRLEKPIRREAYAELNGQAAVQGAVGYFGETG